MNAPSILVERLASAGITEVALIDDVFDGPAFLDIRHRLDTFRESVEDDEPASAELQIRCGIAPGAEVDIQVAKQLWKDISQLGDALGGHTRVLLADYILRRKMVDEIMTHLDGLKIAVTTYGDPGEDLSKLPPTSIHLVLLDYSLAPDSAQPAAASEWCANQLCLRGKDRPFLVLISDQADAAAHKERFRETTNQLGGTFAFIRKQDALKSEILFFQMATWGLGHPAHTHIQTFVEAVIDSMDEIIVDFRRILRKLNVQDYSFIQRISLEEDGQPLGEYILEFLTGLLSHQFRGSVRIRSAREALDRLTFDRLLASETQPSSELAKIYRLALTDPVIGEVGPHPHEEAIGKSQTNSKADQFTQEEVAARAKLIWEQEGRPSNREKEHWYQAESELRFSPPLLALGDIFARDARSQLWMVINAACDLLFSPRSSGRAAKPDQPIYLIPGALKVIRDTGDIGNKEVTELFEYSGIPYRILWDYRFVRSVALRNFKEEMGEKGYRREARLALPYALRIQRAWTAHMDRIGLPSPPPVFEEADVSIYARDKGDQWVRLHGPIRGGATVVRRNVGKNYETFCVLTMDGEAAVHGVLSEAIRLSEERLAEGRKLAEQAKATELFWPKRIKGYVAIVDRLKSLTSDANWRFSLLEEQRSISSYTPAWVINDLVAMYFEAGAQRNFTNNVHLAIDVSRPSPEAGAA